MSTRWRIFSTVYRAVREAIEGCAWEAMQRLMKTATRTALQENRRKRTRQTDRIAAFLKKLAIEPT